MTTLHDFTVAALDGSPHDLARYRGHPVLIVNTASKCGFTPQYAGLEALWQAHRNAGLVVLGFPCNQFGGQEPGDAAAIGAFCDTRYAVTFPMMAKVEVNGPGAHPLWAWLKTQRSGLLGLAAIKWNFTKFLVGPDGAVRSRYAPATKPDALAPDIAVALGG